MNYQVAIPSYQRAGTLAAKTLPLLLERGVDPDRVTVFVADDDEADAYHPVTEAAGVALAVAVPGMGAVRNFIMAHYPADTRLVQVDDDLMDIRRRVDPKTTTPVADLPSEVFAEGFSMADMVGAGLWGIYPVLNPMFMKPRTTTDLRYIVGCFWGSTVHHAAHQLVTLDDKEDFERTIRYYLADGAVVRLEAFAPKTRYYKEPGGMQVTRTEARVDQSARTLAARYPDLCRLNTSKKGGHTELRLRDRRPVA